MPEIRVNGTALHFEDTGAGAETILFSHGLLWSGWMFAEQVAALRTRYRCVTYDHRGQGRSEVSETGYDMETLCEDAAALIVALDCAPCHFVGLSMGGFVGLRLAARRPELLRSLVLLETSADPEPPENVPKYRLLNFVARWFGLGPVAGRVMPIMFGKKFLTDPDRAALRQECRRRLLANHRQITRAVRGVIERKGVYEELDRIKLPTLIGVGDQDVATVAAKAERMQARIAGSKLIIFPGAGHSSTVEEPTVVTAAIQQFLASQ